MTVVKFEDFKERLYEILFGIRRSILESFPSSIAIQAGEMLAVPCFRAGEVW